MSIKLTFPSDLITGRVKALQERIEKATFKELQEMGEKLVTYAKNQHNYKDQSGNLTNSIGYAIIKRQEGVIFSSMDYVQGFPEAVDATQEAMREFAKQIGSSYALIIVAGMNYAEYVEAKGYNVILPAELKAKTDFPKVIEKIKNKAEQKIKQGLM